MKRAIARALLLSASAALGCSTTAATPPTPVSACVAGGGECVPATDTVACGSFLALSCAANSTCCVLVDAGAELLADADGVGDASMPDAPSVGCAALAACCSALPSSDVDACSSIAAAGDDGACAVDLSAFESSGYCGGTAVPLDATADASAKAEDGATTASTPEAGGDARQDAREASTAESGAAHPPADDASREGGRLDSSLVDSTPGG